MEQGRDAWKASEVAVDVLCVGHKNISRVLSGDFSIRSSQKPAKHGKSKGWNVGCFDFRARLVSRAL